MSAPYSSPVSAADQQAILDAVYRFAAGQDYREPETLASAFTEDAVLDFTQPAERLGVTLTPFEGRQQIVDIVMGTTAALTTTHSVSNPRILDFDGDAALLVALVEAQHLPADDHSRHLLLRNKFTVRLRRQGDHWAISHLLIENIWRTGQAEVLFPSA